MGCGGSKHDVVTGNTASRRSLVKKSSDASHCASAANVDTGGNLTADVKDIAISSADGVDVGGGKLLSHSPDRYFSSRRDDAVASDECFDSPLYVPDGDRITAKELKDRTADGVAGSNKAAAAADDQYPAGPLQDELAGDVVKEQIVAEETKFEVTG